MKKKFHGKNGYLISSQSLTKYSGTHMSIIIEVTPKFSCYKTYMKSFSSNCFNGKLLKEKYKVKITKSENY
jgi:hypothetical protein